MQPCTIIAKNYLAQARALAVSMARWLPEARLKVLVIDDIEGFFDPAEEPFDVLRPSQLAIPELPEMRARYGVLELATALKPWLLDHLLDAHPGGVVYLDPDIQLFGPLPAVAAALETHAIVLTPHTTHPMLRDGRRPHEQDILRSGIFNLGFIAVRERPQARALLSWWSERLATDCVVDQDAGLFVDQRWIDFVPGLFDDLFILREPGYNVGHWNIAQRALERGRVDGYTARGEPLQFLHFSGFHPSDPLRFSGYQDRVELRAGDALTELCAGYAELLYANGFEETSRWPFTPAPAPRSLP